MHVLQGSIFDTEGLDYLSIFASFCKNWLKRPILCVFDRDLINGGDDVLIGRDLIGGLGGVTSMF